MTRIEIILIILMLLKPLLELCYKSFQGEKECHKDPQGSVCVCVCVEGMGRDQHTYREEFSHSTQIF